MTDCSKIAPIRVKKVIDCVCLSKIVGGEVEKLEDEELEIVMANIKAAHAPMPTVKIERRI